MATSSTLPKTMKALVLRSTSEPLTIDTVPISEPTIGSAVVRILAMTVLSYARNVYNGKRNYPFPMPLIPGASAVGRIASVSIDATKLKAGDLVFVDCTIRSRDDPTDVYLAGIHEGHTEGSRKLMRDVYRDWTLAEYCCAPLESLTLLNENELTGSPASGGQGYSIEQLSFASRILVPYGGLKDIELQPGQTIIVAPATGPFGGAAVLAALAMGAKVIAMGRNKASLATLKQKVPMPERVETVPITGDMQADCNELKKHGQIDAYFDIGPREAQASTHIKSCILALRHGARISLMGGYREGKSMHPHHGLSSITDQSLDIPIPHVMIVHRNMRLYGKWMYERSDIPDLFKLIEHGMLKLGEASGIEQPRTFRLEEWEEAFDVAAEESGFGKAVVITP